MHIEYLVRCAAKSAAVLAVAATAVVAPPAAAHFQLLYTPTLLRASGGPIVLKMPFSHPAASGYVMEMAPPEQLIMVRRGRRTDLTEHLRQITWTSSENTNVAWEAPVRLRGLGDYVFALTPAPYLEPSEDAYIQQITKTIVNVGGLPTDWDAPLGLPAEIVPLARPYTLYAGGSFSGRVLSAGEPVPFAEIEVEYMNFPPDLAADAFAATGLTTPPHPAFETLSIRADQTGTFTFGLPRAGFWGFAALGVGPETSYQSKDMSQDAVIWVQARDM